MVPFPDSLCHRCRHLKLVNGKQATFLMCLGLETKYPRQPVASCPGFSETVERRRLSRSAAFEPFGELLGGAIARLGVGDDDDLFSVTQRTPT